MKRSTWYTTLVYTLSSLITLFLFLLLIGIELNFFFTLIISLGVGVIILSKTLNKSNKHSVKQLPRLTAQKEEFYLSKGLSKDDIHYFRETMQKAKEQIMTIEKTMKESGKLRAIENRNNTVTLAKGLFKEITQEPNRLHEVDQFLYVHLPSLADLVEKYREIENHKAKSKATYDILEKSADMIDKMSGQIAEDYVKFRKDEIEDMDIEVKLAKRTLNKNKQEFESFNDEI